MPKKHRDAATGQYTTAEDATYEPAEDGRTPLALIESPYAGDVARNERYARACLADSLARGEAPFASHLLYTQPGVLDDTDPAERHQGIQSGLAWGANATLTAVYDDLGITGGMRQGIARAEAEGRPVEVRQLAGWDAPEPARPAETVSETVPARHETPDVAELRRLLDATETPWALWDGYGPDGNGDMRVARIGHLSGSGIRADWMDPRGGEDR